MLKKVLFCAAVAAVEAACPDQPWVVDPKVATIPHTATVVPAVVSFNDELIGWPGNKKCAVGVECNKCDQFIAMGVDDGLVRGVSTSIAAGFSLPYLGTEGEEIEFRYWNDREKKIYYSEHRETFEPNAQLGSFKDDQAFVLILRETPFTPPTKSQKNIEMDVDLTFGAPLNDQQKAIVEYGVCYKVKEVVKKTWGADTTATCELQSTDSGRRLLEATKYKVVVTIVTADSLTNAAALESLAGVESEVEQVLVNLPIVTLANNNQQVAVKATASVEAVDCLTPTDISLNMDFSAETLTFAGNTFAATAACKSGYSPADEVALVAVKCTAADTVYTVTGSCVSDTVEQAQPAKTNPAVKVTAGLASSFLVFAMLQ